MSILDLTSRIASKKIVVNMDLSFLIMLNCPFSISETYTLSLSTFMEYGLTCLNQYDDIISPVFLSTT